MTPHDDQEKPEGGPTLSPQDRSAQRSGPPEGKRDEDERLRSAGLALTIPSLLVAGPIVGLLLGRWIGGMVGYPNGGLLIGLGLGFVAGVREIIKILRRMSK